MLDSTAGCDHEISLLHELGQCKVHVVEINRRALCEMKYNYIHDAETVPNIIINLIQ